MNTIQQTRQKMHNHHPQKVLLFVPSTKKVPLSIASFLFTFLVPILQTIYIVKKLSLLSVKKIEKLRKLIPGRAALCALRQQQ